MEHIGKNGGQMTKQMFFSLFLSEFSLQFLKIDFPFVWLGIEQQNPLRITFLVKNFTSSTFNKILILSKYWKKLGSKIILIYKKNKKKKV